MVHFTYVIIGGLWRDKVNGNTYHKVKFINTETGNIIYNDAMHYGYGKAYKTTAEDFINDQFACMPAHVCLIDGGSFYVRKKDLIHNNF